MFKRKAAAATHRTCPKQQRDFRKVPQSMFSSMQNSGFTATERQMIAGGIQDWNGQPNNSGIIFNVSVTSNPPAPGTNNTIIVSYNDTYSNWLSQL